MLHVAGRALLLLMVVILSAACRLDVLGPRPTPTTPAMGLYMATLREMQLGRYIGIEAVREREIGSSGWVQYDYDQADCRCMDGGQFHLLARPGKHTEYTLVWLSGGGACWPGHDTCTPRAELAQSLDFGLSTQLPANPFRDWNTISVPYCDGSLHMGDSDADYDDDSRVDHYHWGLRTTSAAVTLLRQKFPKSTKIVVAGCGAGGYGTILAVPVIRLQFPEARIYVWNESGPGLHNPDSPETWQLIKDTWNLASYLPDDCPHCRDQLLNVYGWLLARDPGLRVGLYSSYEDAVLSGDILGVQPREFRGLLLTTTDRLREEFPARFKRYLVAGDTHCVEDYFYRVDGITIRDWIEAMVTDDDIRWRDLRE
jgi:hypothetical protein